MTTSAQITSTTFPRLKEMDEDLAACVRKFFEILDITEESDNGNAFRPNVISSCRVFDTNKLNQLLPRMKELSGYVNKHEEHKNTDS